VVRTVQSRSTLSSAFEQATALLANPHRSIAEVADALGCDPATFSRRFRAWSGMAPSQWRRTHAADPARPDQMTISARLLDAIVRAAVAVAGSPTPVPEVAVDRDGVARLPILWEVIAGIVDGPGVGLQIAERFDNDALDVLWQCVRASTTHREALAEIARLLPLLAADLEIAVVETGEVAAVELRTPWLLHPIGAEFCLALLVRNSRLLLSDDGDPLLVELAHPAPRDASAHERWFRCPVRFGARRNAISWPAARLDRSSRPAEPRPAVRVEPRFEREVRREYRRAVGTGDTRITTIARRIGVSVRVLQRELESSGLTHRELVDGARCEAARTLLSHARATVKEVARRLGFASTASFVRSFRRWTGTTPARAR
jgi:AraC-like DNA-binding protein